MIPSIPSPQLMAYCSTNLIPRNFGEDWRWAPSRAAYSGLGVNSLMANAVTYASSLAGERPSVPDYS